MEKSESIKELSTALAKAQSVIKAALKDSANPFFKSKYADLSSVWSACREPLTTNGLAVTQLPFQSEGATVGLETTLLHSSGEWISSKIVVPVSKPDAQGIGSAITYARRYGLASMVGVVADEDDDGEGAVGRERPGHEKVKIDTKVKKAVYEQTIDCLARSDDLGLKQIWGEFDADQKVALWAMFDSTQRSAMKKLMEMQ